MLPQLTVIFLCAFLLVLFYCFHLTYYYYFYINTPFPNYYYYYYCFYSSLITCVVSLFILIAYAAGQDQLCLMCYMNTLI